MIEIRWAGQTYHCPKCERDLPLDAFQRAKNRSKYGIYGYCTECQATKLREIHNQKREQARLYLAEIREATPCADCDVNYPYFVMDFDHRVGEDKIAAVSVMVRRFAGSLEKIRAEVAKCDIVCANCHRARTHYRRLNTATG